MQIETLFGYALSTLVGSCHLVVIFNRDIVYSNVKVNIFSFVSLNIPLSLSNSQTKTDVSIPNKIGAGVDPIYNTLMI